MTYNVLSGTLSLYTTTTTGNVPPYCTCNVMHGCFHHKIVIDGAYQIVGVVRLQYIEFTADIVLYSFCQSLTTFYVHFTVLLRRIVSDLKGSLMQLDAYSISALIIIYLDSFLTILYLVIRGIITVAIRIYIFSYSVC